MKLYLIIQALIGILVKDGPVKSIEHVDSSHMILTTDDARVTITVEKIQKIESQIYVGGSNVFTYPVLPNNPVVTNFNLHGFYFNTTEIKGL